MRHLPLFIWAIFSVLLSTSQTLRAEDAPIIDIPTATNGMVSTQEATATMVGVEILKQGGNAVDAAVAVGFALAVTYPRAGNLGGGGFMLIYQAESESATSIDYREIAPAAAHRDMFLDEDGNVDNQKARFSALSSGVPGTVAGMVYAQQKYGTMPLAKVIQPAIDLAEQGFAVPEELRRSLLWAEKRLTQHPSSRDIYFPNGKAPETGSILKQPELAAVLKAIQKQGHEGFYKGPVAKMIADDSHNHDGIITEQDLANYKAVERIPVSGTYRDHQVIAMPPPSSGGIHLIQMLNIMELWDMTDSGANTATTINRMVESMKRAYADRSMHLGDPDFYAVPQDKLIDKAYAAQLHGEITKQKVTPSSEIAPVVITQPESPQTTHYTVMDRYGNAVANTYTLNASFGNGRVAVGTGILMNNEMDDFSSKPGVPNMFGLIGGEANAIEAGKRPLSSMTPTIVLKDKRALLATGSVGGSRIITTVLQVISNVIDHDMDILTATTTPRFHHQWLPDSLVMENGFTPDVLNQLRTMGYSVDAPELMGHGATPAGREIGHVQSVMFKNGQFTGTADPRRPHSLAAGY